MNNFKEALRELQKAAQLDPTDPGPHIDLGIIHEEQKEYEKALQEYGNALNLDNTNANAHTAVGRILLLQKNIPGALDELKQAVDLKPADASIHDQYAKALVASGNDAAAISELRQAISLDPKEIQIRLELAAALEKNGDWAGAINEFRRAALDDASVPLQGKIIRNTDRDAQRDYGDAQKRLDAHLAQLKTAGKSSEAADLQKRILASQASSSLSDQVDATMQFGAAANNLKQWDEAAREYQKAVDLADKLQPHDPRLVTALDHLGYQVLGRDPAVARDVFERELKVAQELYGPRSPNLAAPLESLGRNSLFQKDYASAEKFFFRAVDLNAQVFGESSNQVATSLVQASTVYFADKDYAKAEPYLVRAVRIDESLYGADNVGMLLPRATLCGLYDRWDQTDKAVACNRQLLAVLEKQFGESSPQLVNTLASQAKALRKLGQTAEADKIDQRLAQIRATTMNPN
jgi:tetratricopeptide (TPR) repeat protein